MYSDTIREFETENFKVIVRAEDDNDLDLSWDETGEVLEGLQSGKYVAFCAHALVIYKPTGATLADDYLGGCIYESRQKFMDHKECGEQNREYERKGIAGRCGSYFTDMVRNVCSEARKAIADMQNVKVRRAQ